MFARRITATITVGALALTLAGQAGAETQKVSWREVCRFTDDRLTEISGMAHSSIDPHLLWVINDSGDDAVVYGIDSRSCATVSEVRLRGVRARDFEGLASSRDARGRPQLWVGDIGDNRDSWPDVSIYRVREPRERGSTTRTPRRWRFTYPDRPHNAETLMVSVDRVWAATWQLASGGIYSVPLSSGVAIARRVGDVGPLTTDGSIHPSGTGFALRDYLDVHIYRGLPPGRRLATYALPPQMQGEAITWAPDGRSLFVASEKDTRLLRIYVPESIRSALDG